MVAGHTGRLEAVGWGRENSRNSSIDLKTSLLAAVLDPKIALNHQPNERIGIVAKIIVRIVNRAALEKIRATAVLCRARHNGRRRAGMRMS
jgi:hypothetical protein